jgi:hypothetical protein
MNEWRFGCDAPEDEWARSGACRSYLASAQATGSCIIPCDAAWLFVVIYHCIESKTLRDTIRMRIIK